MRFRGRYGPGGLAYIRCQVVCQNPPFAASVRFAVDTGSSSTVIMDRDAARIGLDYSALEPAPSSFGIGGIQIPTYYLKGISLVFRESSFSYHVRRLGRIETMKHPTHSRIERRLVKAIPSLLGIDVLRKYRIRFDENGVVLAK